jgi:hypothetical protein
MSVGESTPEITSLKLIKKLFISTTRSNALWLDDYNEHFEKHKSMYGSLLLLLAWIRSMASTLGR